MSDTDTYAAVERWLERLAAHRETYLRECAALEAETEAVTLEVAHVEDLSKLQSHQVYSVADKIVPLLALDDLTKPLESLSFKIAVSRPSPDQIEAYSMASTYLPAILAQYQRDVKHYASTQRRAHNDLWKQLTLDNLFDQPVYTQCVMDKVADASRPHYQLARELVRKKRRSGDNPRRESARNPSRPETMWTDAGLKWMADERAFAAQTQTLRQQMVGLGDDYAREMKWEADKHAALDSAWVDALRAEMQQSLDTLFDVRHVMNAVRVEHRCKSEPAMLVAIGAEIARSRSAVLKNLDAMTVEEFVARVDEERKRLDAPPASPGASPGGDGLAGTQDGDVVLIVRQRAAVKVQAWAARWRSALEDKAVRGHWPTIDECGSKLSETATALLRELSLPIRASSDGGPDGEERYVQQRKALHEACVRESVRRNTRWMLASMKSATQSSYAVVRILSMHDWRAAVCQIEARPYSGMCGGAVAALEREHDNEHKVGEMVKTKTWAASVQRAIVQLELVATAMTTRLNEWQTHGRQVLSMRLFEARVRECTRGGSPGDRIAREWWAELLDRVAAADKRWAPMGAELEAVAKRMLSVSTGDAGRRAGQPLLVMWTEAQQAILIMQWAEVCRLQSL